MTSWLAERVASSGSVLAIDLEHTGWSGCVPSSTCARSTSRPTKLPVTRSTSCSPACCCSTCPTQPPLADSSSPQPAATQRSSFKTQTSAPSPSTARRHSKPKGYDDYRHHASLRRPPSAWPEASGAAGSRWRRCSHHPEQLFTRSRRRTAARIVAITIERFRTRAISNGTTSAAIDAAISALRDPKRSFAGPTQWIVRARPMTRRARSRFYESHHT